MSFVEATPEFVAAAAGIWPGSGRRSAPPTPLHWVRRRVCWPRRRRGVGEYRRTLRRALPGLSGAQRPGGRVSQPVRATDERRCHAVRLGRGGQHHAVADRGGPGVGGRAGTGGERRPGPFRSGRTRGPADGGGGTRRHRGDARTGRHAGRGGSGGIGDAGLGHYAGRCGAGGHPGLRPGQFSGRGPAGGIGGDAGRPSRGGHADRGAAADPAAPAMPVSARTAATLPPRRTRRNRRRRRYAGCRSFPRDGLSDQNTVCAYRIRRGTASATLTRIPQ